MHVTAFLCSGTLDRVSTLCLGTVLSRWNHPHKVQSAETWHQVEDGKDTRLRCGSCAGRTPAALPGLRGMSERMAGGFCCPARVGRGEGHRYLPGACKEILARSQTCKDRIVNNENQLHIKIKIILLFYSVLHLKTADFLQNWY